MRSKLEPPIIADVGPFHHTHTCADRTRNHFTKDHQLMDYPPTMKKNEVTGSHLFATFFVSSVLTAILSADLSPKALATAEASAKEGAPASAVSC